jgi:hypothetical protein
LVGSRKVGTASVYTIGGVPVTRVAISNGVIATPIELVCVAIDAGHVGGVDVIVQLNAALVALGGDAPLVAVIV